MCNLPAAEILTSSTRTIISLFAGLSSINIGISGPRFSITLCDDLWNCTASKQNVHVLCLYTWPYLYHKFGIFRSNAFSSGKHEEILVMHQVC